jgi:hypothetical protein
MSEVCVTAVITVTDFSCIPPLWVSQRFVPRPTLYFPTQHGGIPQKVVTVGTAVTDK